MAYDDIGGQVTGILEGRDANSSGDTVTNAKDNASTIRSVSKDGLPPQAEQDLVKEILGKIKDWKRHHKQAFKKMKEDVRFASNKHGAQWNGTKNAPMKELYVAQITFRHIQSRTGVLYAKNPRVKAQRRKRLDHKIWDGTQQQLDHAKQAIDAANGVPPPGPPPNPEMIKVQGELKLAAALNDAKIALINAQIQLAQAQAGVKAEAVQAKTAADQTEHALEIEATHLSAVQELQHTEEAHQTDMAVARSSHAQDMKIAADKAAQDAKLKAAQARKPAAKK